MDNIGLFDRSTSLGPGYRLEESDSTSWMAFYCLIDAEHLARTGPHGPQVWDDLATKFLEHFLAIANAVNNFGSEARSTCGMTHDGFCYDVLTPSRTGARGTAPGALDGRVAADPGRGQRSSSRG